ncbi:jg7209 [Pararge aegeria aegeria]|uniref:Jg7209 protein n=1 Tax=Pararge aegeria aegeria TaxID=348720 RepID=A0A8S4R4E8_9NEOP|nr:jg7209 [Pararge aegeria aegeria]
MAMVVASEKKCDFIALSEPNLTKCKSNNKHMYVSEDLGAMIINYSQRYDVTKYRTVGCWICVETKGVSLYSVYISPNKCSPEGFLNHLGNIQQTLQAISS